LTDKRVAGTVILHLQNGSKKFLVHSIEGKEELVCTDLLDNRTGLANILDYLKTEVKLDISHCHLVELTNGQTDQTSMPLFVFETTEQEQKSEIPLDYTWEEPHGFRKIIQDYEIEGMPLFE